MKKNLKSLEKVNKSKKKLKELDFQKTFKFKKLD
jgi:hypothetical protein